MARRIETVAVAKGMGSKVLDERCAGRGIDAAHGVAGLRGFWTFSPTDHDTSFAHGVVVVVRYDNVVPRLGRFQFDHDRSLDQRMGCIRPDGNPMMLRDDPPGAQPITRPDSRLSPVSFACICVHLRLKFLAWLHAFMLPSIGDICCNGRSRK